MVKILEMSRGVSMHYLINTRLEKSGMLPNWCGLEANQRGVIDKLFLVTIGKI